MYSDKMKSPIKSVLDTTIGGSVHVDCARSKNFAGNGFVNYLTFYETGNMAPLGVSMHGVCSNEFDVGQSVVVSSMLDGAFHSSTCEDCVNEIVQKGDFTTLEVAGDGLSGAIAWNAKPSSVKAHLEQSNSQVVRVTRTVLDKYGTIEWKVTFTKNEGLTPPGSGNCCSAKPRHFEM